MSLSNNIKKFRLEKKLTQDQLAALLDVSAQAISKWETTETMPDTALLLPLANALDVSLDELFDKKPSMETAIKTIHHLIANANREEHMRMGYEIAWHIHWCLYSLSQKPQTYTESKSKSSPDQYIQHKRSSYLIDNYGFTVVSNGNEPFFSIFPEPEEGFGEFLESREDWQSIFVALSNVHTLNALIYLYRNDPHTHLYQRNAKYIFEDALLAKECDIPDEQIDTVINDLTRLHAVIKQEVCINGEHRTLYASTPDFRLLALLRMAKECRCTGNNSLVAQLRYAPLIKKSPAPQE